MDPKRNKVSLVLWGLIVLAVVGVVVGKMLVPKPSAPPMPQLFAVGPVTLTDQDGKTFSTAELRGHPWVADFIFTSCAGSCPIMSHQMVGIQAATPAAVRLVSFSVDPLHDTPAILKEYGAGLRADFSRWHFLTGTQQQMADAAYQMKIAVRPADKDSALTHSEKFLLVDGSGYVVGIYEGTDAVSVKKLETDAKRLAGSPASVGAQ